ncbi:hypothetical protein ABZ948_36175, partial [Streptomyces olindensis]
MAGVVGCCSGRGRGRCILRYGRDGLRVRTGGGTGGRGAGLEGAEGGGGLLGAAARCGPGAGMVLMGAARALASGTAEAWYVDTVQSCSG